jgi:tRNA pseudouridine38-40 synthase
VRYFIRFSYFGKAYHGWQRQPNAHTVQEVMETAFCTLLRYPVSLVAAGRTDAGVHARDMAAHADVEDSIDPVDLTYRLNALLPADIAVREILPVRPEAHARFDAIERTYEYWVVQQKNPFYTDTAHYINLPLDLPAMNTAASAIMAFKDFRCFSKSNSDVKTYNCDIRHAEWSPVEDRLVFTITADRFLRNMVRAAVGTLLEVGLGKSSVDDVKGIIKSRDRSRAGVSVPAKGLYLTRVCYPEHLFAK